MDPLAIFFSMASLILAILNYKLNKEKHDREKTLERFKEFAKNLTMIDEVYIDAIILGPRESGKTSIVQLWTSPWTQIDNMKPSAVWQEYEVNIHEFDEEIRTNLNIQIEQTYRPILTLRVHDYPGENSYRTQAIKKLEDLGEKAVLVFVFHVGFENGKILYSADNTSYFSAQFADTVFNRLKSISGTVAKAIVVFNKADLLPPDWSDFRAIQELKKANKNAINHIEGLFSGNLEYHLTSALTNKGLVKLLGSIGVTGIESKREIKSFNQQFEKIQETYGILER